MDNMLFFCTVTGLIVGGIGSILTFFEKTKKIGLQMTLYAMILSVIGLGTCFATLVMN